MGGHRDDVVEREVAQHTCLNLDLLGVGLPFHLVAGLQLVLLHHTGRLKHLDGLGVEITIEDDGGRLLGVETALGSLLNPLVGISVAIEVDGRAGLDVVANHAEDGGKLILALGNELVHTGLEVVECLGHSGIEHDLGAGAVGA